MNEFKIEVTSYGCSLMNFEFIGKNLQEAVDEAMCQKEYWEGEGYGNVSALVNGQDCDLM